MKRSKVDSIIGELDLGVDYSLDRGGMADTTRTPLVDLPETVLHDVEVLCKRTPREEVGGAIKRLRERVGLTQEKVGHRFRRTASACATWESGKKQPPRGMTVALLETFLLPRIVIEQYVSVGPGSDLDAIQYATKDAVDLEAEFFQRTRGHVLQSVYQRSIEGDPIATKIYVDWMRSNERAQVTRITLGPGSKSGIGLGWIEGALRTVRQIAKVAESGAGVVAPIETTGEATEHITGKGKDGLVERMDLAKRPEEV